jgi:cytochrome c oxidase subunit III
MEQPASPADPPAALGPPATPGPPVPSDLPARPDPPAAPAASRLGRLGMVLFLVALGVLFAASMTGYLVVRLRAPTWPPAGSPRLPAGLWISTLILLVSSLTMHVALGRARRGQNEALRNWLLVTLLLGIAFLVSQLLNWSRLVTAQPLRAQANLYAFTFYMLTGLHGAHVLGGLVPLGLTTTRAGGGRYTPESHEGIVHLSMYWHFLDAVWLVMFLVLMAAA